MFKLTVLASILLLSGCAAMSEAECRTGDWYSVGERDGRDGQKSQLGDYAKACEKANVLPDPVEYAKGRDAGLRTYCTPQNGYRVGRDGQSYRNVCSTEQQADFLREYERGRVRYELKRDIDNLERDLRRYSADIDRLNDAISNAKNDDERNKLRHERESNERKRRDGQLSLIGLKARWLVQGD